MKTIIAEFYEAIYPLPPKTVCKWGLTVPGNNIGSERSTASGPSQGIMKYVVTGGNMEARRAVMVMIFMAIALYSVRGWRREGM